MSDYTLEWLAVVRAFVEALSEADRSAVYHALDLLKQGLILAERVQSEPVPTYKLKVGADKTRWPNDLRVFFRVSHSRATFYIVDVGDHTTSALYPGQSIYPDER